MGAEDAGAGVGAGGPVGEGQGGPGEGPGLPHEEAVLRGQAEEDGPGRPAAVVVVLRQRPGRVGELGAGDQGGCGDCVTSDEMNLVCVNVFFLLLTIFPFVFIRQMEKTIFIYHSFFVTLQVIVSTALICGEPVCILKQSD